MILFGITWHILLNGYKDEIKAECIKLFVVKVIIELRELYTVCASEVIFELISVPFISNVHLPINNLNIYFRRPQIGIYKYL